MRVISSREFRANQAAYFNEVDNGTEILIHRKNRAYKIVPVTELDTLIPNEYILPHDAKRLADAMAPEEFITKAQQHLRKVFNQTK